MNSLDWDIRLAVVRYNGSKAIGLNEDIGE